MSEPFSVKILFYFNFFPRCRAKGGFRLEGVEATSRLWTVRAEMNARGTVATVNAFKKNLETTVQGTKKTTEKDGDVTSDDLEG